MTRFKSNATGPEPGDPFVIVQPERPYLAELEQPTGILRIGVARTAWANMPISAEVLAEVDRVAALLADMGHKIEEIPCPIDPEDLMVGVMGAFNFDLVGLRDDAAALGRQIGPDTLEPVTLKLLEMTEAMTPAQIGSLLATLDKIRFDVSRSTAQYDILLTPTLPVVAPEHGLYSTNHPSLTAEEYMANDPMLFGFQGTFNVTGQPAVSLPTGSNAAGLPIGIQLVAPFGDEAALIRLSRDLSEASPWGNALPAILEKVIRSGNGSLRVDTKRQHWAKGSDSSSMEGQATHT